MALKTLDRKLVLGVEHGNGEQRKVFDLLNAYKVPSIGLEITPGDLANKKLLQVRHKKYWESLKSYYRNVGTSVIALDHPIVDDPSTRKLGDAWILLHG